MSELAANDDDYNHIFSVGKDATLGLAIAMWCLNCGISIAKMEELESILNKHNVKLD